MTPYFARTTPFHLCSLCVQPTRKPFKSWVPCIGCSAGFWDSDGGCERRAASPAGWQPGAVRPLWLASCRAADPTLPPARRLLSQVSMRNVLGGGRRHAVCWWRSRSRQDPLQHSCSTLFSLGAFTIRTQDARGSVQRQKLPLQQRIPNLTRLGRESVGAGCAARQSQAIVAPHSGHGGCSAAAGDACITPGPCGMHISVMPHVNPLRRVQRPKRRLCTMGEPLYVCMMRWAAEM